MPKKTSFEVVTVSAAGREVKVRNVGNVASFQSVGKRMKKRERELRVAQLDEPQAKTPKMRHLKDRQLSR